ncbi:hypothetical protein SAMD00019534_091260 [Acytostelium subglobosum LB1]|uniref:hypothetical protein n=1 Tax=Acytostelium subglobosum LB1 TaxID=1410327 RepID=UPI000644C0C1|nr:hypothetical protein SAMD00019534_091260 [Acytostelium subglobosum LB1]GAM25951.1 hypothetical protein SAMD00019534_091260 [Acytostelium subglobosum LB1]|eukprot:XP_012750994.1 hypothetical protein SAMD00019534_091260 [Acytostelium subglobosum LB1]
MFLEIKQSTTTTSTSADSYTAAKLSSTTQQDSNLGLNFAFKEEVQKFFDCYNQCIRNLAKTSINIASIPSVMVAPPAIESKPQQHVNNNHLNKLASISVSSSKSKESSATTSASSSTGGSVGANGINILALPLPPPPTAPRNNKASNSTLTITRVPQPPAIGKGGSMYFTYSPGGQKRTASLQDLFSGDQNASMMTKTTTTTITPPSPPDRTVVKTASGRRSIRSRGKTDLRRTLTRKEFQIISKQNVEGLQNIGEALEEETLNLIDLVNEQVINSTSDTLINQSIRKIFDHLQVLFILTAESASSHHAAMLIARVIEIIDKGPPTMDVIASQVGWNWYNLEEISSLGSGFTNLLYLKKNLVPTIAYLSTSVRVLGLQASLEAEWMSRNRSQDPVGLVVQLACLSKELLTAICRLQMATHSFSYVCNCLVNSDDRVHTEPEMDLLGVPVPRNRSSSAPDLINLWDEMKQLNEFPSFPKDGSILKASLNQLVILLTSDTHYDTRYLKTFITTYQSFTQPKVLFNKLLERYTIPSWYHCSEPRKVMIRQRVILTIKYWIVNQPSDFDQELLAQISYFVEHTIMNDGYYELSRALKEALDKMKEDREVKTAILFQMPPRINFTTDCILSPIELFLDWNPMVIAQQLTLIDFAMFKEIEARELLNQNFNNPKTKYRSPNVMRMINRATQLSFYVAKLILLEGKKEKRLKVFQKILDVAKYLLKCNNFNTLMSIHAGLNLTPIHRLKKTKKKLSSSANAILAECDKIFSSKKSFKYYRDIMAGMVQPCIPYLGIHLTDLTFIEQGNQDYLQPEQGATALSPLINFKKRELVYQAWSDLSRFQQLPYPFTSEEPINTFLLHFPVLEEKELYELSSLLEPNK